MSGTKGRPITAEDLYRFQVVNEAEISPDGGHVVYSRQWVKEDTEEKYSNLWIVPTAGGASSQFTVGDHVDSKPHWSPDGTRIAFLSNREDKKQPQLYLIPVSGGEARQLTDLQGEFGALSWSPDGMKILIQFRKKDQDAVEREKDETRKELGVVSRHVTRVFYKRDGEGYLPQERWHLWVIDVETGDARQLTDGNVHDEIDPGWSPDGEHIIYLSNYAEDPDLAPDMMDIYLLSVEDRKVRRLKTPVGPKQKPVFSPDGSRIAYLGKEGRGVGWKNSSLWVVPVDGSGEATNLTASLDLEVSDATINDLPGGLPMSPPAWSGDGQRIYFQVSTQGKTVIQSIAADGEGNSLETVVGGQGTVGDFTHDQEQNRIAYLYGDMTHPADVWLMDLNQGKPRQLTQVNDALLKEVDLGSAEEVWFENNDGTELQGWILKPPGFDPARTYPSIMEIHGGPRTQYGYLFMHEFFALAAQGYVVYFSNPRGSRGYGESFSKEINNDWGAPAYEDLMAWADYMEQQPYIDPERMGVTGGSYGGYMTVWIIGHTDRFRAAVTQRCVSNWISMVGSSDVNWAFQREFGDEPPWEDLENYWRLSPISAIGSASTPTLVIHSENDLRCPIEQGEQVFVALKRLGVETEMVRFPEEFHGLSRGGRTDRRVERLHHITRWFDRFLTRS